MIEKRFISICLFLGLLNLLPLDFLHGQDSEVPSGEQNPVDADNEIYELGGEWNLKDFMGVVSKATGRQFIYNENDINNRVIQFSDNTKIEGPQRLYQLFELVIKGQKMITKTEMGNKVRVEKINREIRSEPWRVVEDDELDSLRKSYQVVTRVEEIANGNPKTIATQLQALLNTDVERVVGLEGTNILIISAYSHNVERLTRIIQIMDTKLDKMNVYTVPCFYALASDLSNKINSILQHQSKSVPNFQTGRPKIGPLVVADERTQNLIIVGLEEHHIEVKRLVKQLDIKVQPLPSRFQIFPVANRTADELVSLINSIYEGKKSLEDEQGVEQAPRPNRPQAAAPNAPAGDDDGGGGFGSEIPKVVADVATNSVIALSSNQRVFDELLDLIFKLDVKQPQVFVEVTILEIGDNSERQLGFELLSLENASEGEIRPFAVTSFGNSTVNSISNLGRVPLADSSGSLQSGLVAGIFKDSADRIPLLLRAVENNSDSKIVAVPRILTTNNKDATFEIRSAIPTTRTDTNDVASTTSFGGNEEAVTELKITPSISIEFQRDQDGNKILDANDQFMINRFIRLKLEQKITRFVGESTDPALPPSKLERSAVTEVTIPDEATIVIGGFTSSSDSRAIDKVPFVLDLIRKVPILGTNIVAPILEPLLQRQTTTRERSTLYIFVTPHIVTDFEALRDLRENLLRSEDIDQIMEEYGLTTEFERENRRKELEKKRKKIAAENERLNKEEQRQLVALQRRWEKESEEIRERGRLANLDEDDIEWEVSTTRRCREDMFILLRALESYQVRSNSFPTTSEGLGILYKDTRDGLPALLSVEILDPWGAEFEYFLLNDRPVIRSFGADRKPGGRGIDQDLEMSLVP